MNGRHGAPLPARAAWWAVPGALVGLVLGGALAGVADAVTHNADSASVQVLGEIGLWAGMLGTVVLVSRRYGSGRLRQDFALAARPADLGWGLLAAVTALVVSGAVLLAFSHSRFSGTNDQILTGQQGHGAGFVALAVVVAAGAPFFEELFFRGFLRTTLQARFGPHGAVFAQAVLFALAHLGEAGTALGNVSVVIALFFVGVVLGYTAKLTGRLGAGMVAHGMFNLWAVLSLL